MIEKMVKKPEDNRDVPWVMMQRWENLLFAHWPISPKNLIPHIPQGLELDTYDGQAWISIVSFKVSKVRLRNLPRIPYVRPMLQVNARTYVRRNGEKGVYFFSLDTNKLSAVIGAKLVNLPFFHSNMAMRKIAQTYHMYSSRKGKKPGSFKASYKPVDEQFYLEEESLDYWLLERYILWSYNSGGLYKGEIDHNRWEVQHAKLDIEKQSLFSFLPDDAIEKNLVVHYARSKVARNGIIKKVE